MLRIFPLIYYSEDSPSRSHKLHKTKMLTSIFTTKKTQKIQLHVKTVTTDVYYEPKWVWCTTPTNPPTGHT